MVPTSRARRAFIEQRQAARKRGIAWEFTFDAWWQMWVDSGKWAERGKRKGQYCMARFGDEGPYSPNNVRICTGRENRIEAFAKLTLDQVLEIRQSSEKSLSLAERFGVSANTISDVRTGKSFRIGA